VPFDLPADPRQQFRGGSGQAGGFGDDVELQGEADKTLQQRIVHFTAEPVGTLATPGSARAQTGQGQYLLSPRQESILACNPDSSNCFNVVGSSKASGDPSGGDQDVAAASYSWIAANGTIAFTALYGPDGRCSGNGSQGICKPHVFLMDADGTKSPSSRPEIRRATAAITRGCTA
jgi:hypothetical protein